MIRTYLQSNNKYGTLVNPRVPSPGQPQDFLQLPEGHYTPSKFPMVIVAPRPTEEQEMHSRYRWAHPDIDVQIKVSARGGSWPFYYELVSGPSGATIGSTLEYDELTDTYFPPKNYGVISWTPSQAQEGQSFTFVVKVWGQDGGSDTVTFTMTVDSTRFIFVDPAVSTSGSGTIDSPFKTMRDYYGVDENDSTYSGKIVYYREGTTVVVGDVDPGGRINYHAQGSTKPVAHLGYPGESVILDTSGSHFMFGGMAGHDIYFQGVTIKGNRTDQPNTKVFYVVGQWDRTTVDDVIFEDQDFYGTNPNDNPGVMMFWGLGALEHNPQREYVAITRIHHKNGRYQLIGSFDSKQVIVEHITFENCDYRDDSGNPHNGSIGINFKDETNFVTVRCVDASSGAITHASRAIVEFPNQGIKNGNQELCWSNIVTEQGGRGKPVQWNSQSGGTHGHTYGPIYAYRLSIHAQQTTSSYFCIGASYQGEGYGDPLIVEDCVLVNIQPAEPQIQGDAIEHKGRLNILANSSDSIVDSECRLTGESRSMYLGRKGFEVAI